MIINSWKRNLAVTSQLTHLPAVNSINARGKEVYCGPFSMNHRGGAINLSVDDRAAFQENRGSILEEIQLFQTQWKAKIETFPALIEAIPKNTSTKRSLQGVVDDF